jgi:hypothetical protein
MAGSLTLKRASASRPSGEWKDEDYDVFADGKVVDRIYQDGPASFPPDRSRNTASLRRRIVR